MRRISWYRSLTVAARLLSALAAVPLVAAEQPGEIMSGSGTLGSGIIVRFRTMAEPPLGKDLRGMTGGISVHPDRVQRDMIDLSNRQYFGYDLVVERTDRPDRLRVLFEPLSRTPAGMSPAPIPKFPLPQVVDDGDTIALDLLVSADGRRKIVDYIQVTAKALPGPAADTAQPRDFTLDDGPLTFHFAGPSKLFLNGQEFQGGSDLTQKNGGTLWFAFPNRGRYILSLAPHDGFQKAGAIRDHVITFQSEGERFEFRDWNPIIGSGGAWNLYVLHDLTYQSKGGAVHMGTDRLENLLPRR